MGKPFTKQEMHDIVLDYVKTEVGGLDTCIANILQIVDRIPDHTAQGFKMEQQIKAAIAQGGLIANQQIDGVVRQWFQSLTGRDYEPNYANQGLLRKCFLYPTGKSNGEVRTLETLSRYADQLIANGQLSKSQEAINAERETQQQVAAATRQVQEQTRMVQELLAPWAAKVSKNPYVAGSNEITAKQFAAKEDALYALSFEELTAQHADTMQKRALRNMSPADLKLHVRANYEAKQGQYVVGTQVHDRYQPLPATIKLNSSDLNSRPLTAELLRWLSRNDLARYKSILNVCGSENVSRRLDGKDGI